MNRAGTQLAVAWSENGSSEAQDQTIQGILKSYKLSATELAPHARAQALKQFRSGIGWHRADEMDQLSREEAGIIAARILRRVQAKTPMPETKAALLRRSLTETLKERFVGSPARASRTPEQELEDFLDKAASYLNETEAASLRGAFGSGLRPLPGEQ